MRLFQTEILLCKFTQKYIENIELKLPKLFLCIVHTSTCLKKLKYDFEIFICDQCLLLLILKFWRVMDSVSKICFDLRSFS